MARRPGTEAAVRAAAGGRRAGPRRWRQDPAGRRERILEAGAREFGARGFRGARMERVARAAGVAEGTVYHLFGSKQGLLVAVGERYGRGLAEAAFGDRSPELTPEALGRIVRNVFRYVRETDGPLAAFLLASDPMEGTPARDASRTQMVAAIRAQLERGIRAGRIPPLDTRIAAEIQFGLVETALRDCFLRHAGRDEDGYIREVTRCLAAYLGHPIR